MKKLKSAFKKRCSIKETQPEKNDTIEVPQPKTPIKVDCDIMKMYLRSMLKDVKLYDFYDINSYRLDELVTGGMEPNFDNISYVIRRITDLKNIDFMMRKGQVLEIPDRIDKKYINRFIREYGISIKLLTIEMSEEEISGYLDDVLVVNPCNLDMYVRELSGPNRHIITRFLYRMTKKSGINKYSSLYRHWKFAQFSGIFDSEINFDMNIKYSNERRFIL